MNLINCECPKCECNDKVEHGRLCNNCTNNSHKNKERLGDVGF